MTDLHTDAQTFLADCNQNQSAKGLVTRLLEALRESEREGDELEKLTDELNQENTRLLEALGVAEGENERLIEGGTPSRRDYACAVKNRDGLLRKVVEQEARITTLQAALEPFVEAAQEIAEAWPESEGHEEYEPNTHITVAQWRSLAILNDEPKYAKNAAEAQQGVTE